MKLNNGETIDQIETRMDRPLSEITVYCCGPKALCQSLQKAFAENGLASRKFKYEEFRIGLGLLFTPFLNGGLRFGNIIAAKI